MNKLFDIFSKFGMCHGCSKFGNFGHISKNRIEITKLGANLG